MLSLVSGSYGVSPKPEYVMMESPVQTHPSLEYLLEFWSEDRINAAKAHPVFAHGHNSETPEHVDWKQVRQAVFSKNSEWWQQEPLNILDSLHNVDRSALVWNDKCGFPLGTSAVPTSAYSVFPFSVIGWLVAHDSRLNLDYACSASLVGGVLATAGHCIGENGYFYTNLMFIPQRNGPNFPYGKWPVSGVKAYSCWVQQGLWECDYAFASVEWLAPISNGSMGIAANVQHQGTYMACGYPSAKAFNGSMYCTRNAAVKVTSCCKQIPSKMVSGASGGPWIIGCNPNTPTDPSSQTNFVNGVTSHKKSENSLDLWSPRFTQATYQLYLSVNKTRT
jgi:hypothetical protein